MATHRSTTTRRTLHYYWQVTRKHFGLFAALMASTFLFVALLSYGNPYVMSLVVDRVSAGSVEADQVFAAYGPYIVALIAINVLGQAASKLQDYTMYKLEIAAAYDLATMSFDALCNQSMSFHSNRFGGTLVSQTSKFMSAYQLLLETITFPFLPVICSVIFTCAILAPRVPIYVAILMALLVVYACVSYYMYKRILSLNEKAASAQNQLSGELSDSVANILAVKTSGREDYERALFDQLRAITGVGSKLALSVLSTFSPAVLAQIVTTQDTARMAQVPGVGRKKASRLIVELSDVFSKDAELRGLVGLTAPSDASLPLSAGAPAGVEADATEALLSMGFTSQEAELALEGHAESGAVTVEQVLAYALRRLGSGR